MKKNVLGIFAHPDDAEIMAAGTLSLLRKAGWKVHIVTMTPGDKGSATLTREEISRIRMAEAAASAELLDGAYYCLGFEDIYLMYCRETINATTALVRRVQPDLVITASPSDYMADHEITGRIVQTACFSAGIKNMEIKEPTLDYVPSLLYCDAMDGVDILGNQVLPAFYVDISGEIPVKEKMLACHESQRSWLQSHHKMEEYILAMKRFSSDRGAMVNTAYAEGFRQHLGHGFPKENVLKNVLGKAVIET